MASDAFRSPFINGALVSEEIYTPRKRGGELAQIYERGLRWRDAGSYYLTFEQRMRKKIGDGGDGNWNNKEVEVERNEAPI